MPPQEQLLVRACPVLKMSFLSDGALQLVVLALILGFEKHFLLEFFFMRNPVDV